MVCHTAILSWTLQLTTSCMFNLSKPKEKISTFSLVCFLILWKMILLLTSQMDGSSTLNTKKVTVISTLIWRERPSELMINLKKKEALKWGSISKNRSLESAHFRTMNQWSSSTANTRLNAKTQQNYQRTPYIIL